MRSALRSEKGHLKSPDYLIQDMTVSKYELDATSEEWELIAETAIRLWKAGSMFQKSVNVSGIIWPTAAHLCRELTEDLKACRLFGVKNPQYTR